MSEPHVDSPIHGGLLVGGRSRRMGRPKALLAAPGGTTLAGRAAAALSPWVDDLWLLGDGPVPAELDAVARLADAADAPGPLAGLLAALRHRPDGTWLTCPCDLPHVRAEAVAWLLAQRRPGRAAVLPRVDDGPPEPLFALYEPTALPLLEALVAAGRTAPRRLAEREGVVVVRVPDELARCWRDADTPGELARERETGAR